MIELFLLGSYEPPKNPLLPEPIIEQKIEQPVIVLTAQEQLDLDIKNNIYGCDEALYWISAENAECLLKPVYVPVIAQSPPETIKKTVEMNVATKPVDNRQSGLIGSRGSVRSGGNCVNEVGVNNPGRGNPITWAVTSKTPTIGATALWKYNHTGVVTGIYGDGEWIEVRHQNYSGGRTKFHISEFRGYR